MEVKPGDISTRPAAMLLSYAAHERPINSNGNASSRQHVALRNAEPVTALLPRYCHCRFTHSNAETMARFFWPVYAQGREIGGSDARVKQGENDRLVSVGRQAAHCKLSPHQCIDFARVGTDLQHALDLFLGKGFHIHFLKMWPGTLFIGFSNQNSVCAQVKKAHRVIQMFRSDYGESARVFPLKRRGTYSIRK